MCGIVGTYNVLGKGSVDKELLVNMNNTQHHRGPDECDVYSDDHIGLGHTRLSIIDLSNGQQPMLNADRSVALVYNGEIYNHKEIRKELEEDGFQFQTNCDTEVVLYAWVKWKEDCVHKFRGMFAFAIWDKVEKHLFLARDRLGIKPLYYSLLNDGTFIFGSELKSLVKHPGIDKAIDPAAVEDYFTFGYIPDPKSIFKNTKKLKPGHTLSVKYKETNLVQTEYWDIHFNPENVKSESELQDELKSRLQEAVDIRMVADVPLGAFLSGGVDSSAVVAMMADKSNEKINTCAISFGQKEYNESQYAQMIADQYQTNHFVEQVDKHDFLLADKLPDIYDEPFADSSSLPTYRVCELARKHVTVALSGDGGDENFAGYRRYRWHMYEEKVRGKLPAALRSSLFGVLGAVYPKMDWAPKIFRAKTTLQAIAKNSAEAYLHSVSITSQGTRNKLFSNSLTGDLQGYRSTNVYDEYIENTEITDPLSLVQYLDFKTYLPGDILTKVDRASMANSLEVRVPILDHKFVEWVATIPSDYKLRGREGKHVFKKSLESHIPKSILYREKMGFAVPISNWFRNELYEKLEKSLLSDNLLSSNLFSEPSIKKMLVEHKSGKKEHSSALWALYMFSGFQKNILN